MARGCLREAARGLSDVEVMVAAPARRGYRAASASHLGVPVERITVAEDEPTHTAPVAAALHRGLIESGKVAACCSLPPAQESPPVPLYREHGDSGP